MRVRVKYVNITEDYGTVVLEVTKRFLKSEVTVKALARSFGGFGDPVRTDTKKALSYSDPLKEYVIGALLLEEIEFNKRKRIAHEAPSNRAKPTFGFL
jgi:hypothetical protein